MKQSSSIKRKDRLSSLTVLMESNDWELRYRTSENTTEPPQSHFMGCILTSNTHDQWMAINRRQQLEARFMIRTKLFATWH